MRYYRMKAFIRKTKKHLIKLHERILDLALTVKANIISAQSIPVTIRYELSGNLPQRASRTIPFVFDTG